MGEAADNYTGNGIEFEFSDHPDAPDVVEKEMKVIHNQCPKCKAKPTRPASNCNFNIRGQFCMCGWRRDKHE